MKDSAFGKIDHEHWSKLWKEDPAAFEAERTRIIDAFIISLPEQSQARLRSFQWRIDMERRRSKTPLGATLRLYSMMMDSLVGERGLLNALQTLQASLNQQPAKLQQSARVLQFLSLDTSEDSKDD